MVASFRHGGVGNDVVDLLDEEAVPVDADRFDARVFRAAERRAIEAADDAVRERACHWAAKEATYKLLRRQDAGLVFSPVRFEVELAAEPAAWREGAVQHAPRAGRVVHRGEVVSLQVAFEADAVHAVARPLEAGESPILATQLRLGAAEDATPAGQSARVRRLAIAEIAAALQLAPTRLAIEKRGRAPWLSIDGAPSESHLSLSHHGRVVAFACWLAPMTPRERLAS